MMSNNCNICPNKCNVDRVKKYGICKANNKVKIGLASLHFFEEPCISGSEGSGTVFFSHCNLSCVYCQNFKISQENFGKEVSVEHLADIFLNLQKRSANNINLVTPTVYINQIIEAIKIAKSNGLNIPIIYNSSGYESIETIKKLNGYIDIYMPDFKYADDRLGIKYSKVQNYSKIAKEAIKEMYNQVGSPQYDKRGIMKKGIIIRHLILPDNVDNSKVVLKWIKDTFSDNVVLSLMAQYFPVKHFDKYTELNRKVTESEYKEVENYLYDLEIENGYIQELGEHEEEYVPNFDLSE